MVTDLPEVALDCAESYEEFANQRERILVSEDHKLPEYVRLTFLGCAPLMVRIRFACTVRHLAAYDVEYLIKKA